MTEELDDEVDEFLDCEPAGEEDDMPLSRPTTPAARRKWDMAVNRLKQRRHRARLKDITPLEKITKEWCADRATLPAEELETLWAKEKEIVLLRQRIAAFEATIGCPGAICVENRFVEDIVAEADQHNPNELYADIQQFITENPASVGWNASPAIFAKCCKGERFPDWWDHRVEPGDQVLPTDHAEFIFLQYGIDLKLGSEGKIAFWWYFVLNRTGNPDLTAQFIAQKEKQLRDANADPSIGSKYTGDLEFYIFGHSSEARWVLEYLMEHGQAPKMTEAQMRDHGAHLHPKRRRDRR